MKQSTLLAQAFHKLVQTPQKTPIRISTMCSSSTVKHFNSACKNAGSDFSHEVGRALFHSSPERNGAMRRLTAMSVTPPRTPPPGRRAKEEEERDQEPQSLAEAYPDIAGGWVTASNRLINAHTEATSSQRRVWWRCGHCDANFQRSVVRQVECGGKCEACGKKPHKKQSYSALPSAVKFRRLTNRGNLFAESAGRIRPNVTDLSKTANKRSSGGVPVIGKRNLQPMLAQMWQNYRHHIADEDRLMVSPKLDGIRCIAAWNPSTQSVVLLSRHGTVINSCPHVNQALTPLLRVDPWLVLDGELYHHTAFATFEELSGLIRRTKTSGLRGVNKRDAAKLNLIQFHVFDVMESRRVPLSTTSKSHAGQFKRENIALRPFPERYRFLQGLLGSSSKLASGRKVDRHSLRYPLMDAPPPPVASTLQLVPSLPASIEKMDTILRKFQDQGYEGAMVRRGLSGYAHGKRSPFLLKYKSVQDDEYRITGVVEGQGKWKQSLASFVCRTKRGSTFHASPAVSDPRRRRMWDDRRRLVGKMLTVQFQELTQRGIPRFPVGKAIRGSQNKRDWL